ncbi:serine/threonine protein kinase [Rivularia sp. PCC 7116]|uniref:serine/threonine protein kinase n=1 Tax=Rivularia sp. PCC 7116 TaxID=373994 RepID=UPI00029ED26B|nr:protein kinase [Rivularia sp. PCC 7116]AFY57960.1 serine/threonine protein kinase [Rivularia sp. PCC 7116]
MPNSQPNLNAIHCVNPNCSRPYPQPWGNKFCLACGSQLQLQDRFIPLERLGAGGFARIYTVWDVNTQTEKVLKVLVETSPKALELFAQEAEVLQRLKHGGVPKVEAGGYFFHNLSNSVQELDLPCLIMEKINGQTLEEVRYLYPQGCSEELVLDWLKQAVDILRHLHEHMIIHRDIKPSNLMLRNPASNLKNSQLVVIDFGGAKHFSVASSHRQSSSTRLFSTGYSPPEQVTGRNVGPTADFYALARTMIELLTGKNPQELEDIRTGTLRWRAALKFSEYGSDVNPLLVDLLDDMAQEEVRSRPENALIIQKRLSQIIKSTSYLPAHPRKGFFKGTKEFIQQFISGTTQGVSNTTLFAFNIITGIIRGSFETLWTIILACIGACIGTVAGFFLAFATALGDKVGEVVSNILIAFTSTPQPVLGSEIVLFAVSGLTTAWAITLAGGFNQRRRFLIASVMGIIGYSGGWFILQLIPPQQGEGWVGLILFSISLLTFGLGLRSHHIIHAIMTAFGTAIIFAGLINLGLSPTILNAATPFDISQLWIKLAFFCMLGSFTSFWLGVSTYLIVPALKILGWR